MMKRTLPAVCLLLALAPSIRAQDAAQTELIQKLLTRIDSLEKRVEELEKEKAPAAAAVPALTPAPLVAEAAPQTRPAPSPAEAIHSHDTAPAPEIPPGDTLPQYPSLKIAGFGDVDFSALNLHGPNGGFGAQTLLTPHSGFEEGQFVLHLSSALSQRVTVFSEISLTARSDAGTGTPPATGFNVELERLIIRYDLNDYFKLSFGRYHTPINYWNTAFHHGAWLQTTISRPEMIQFGGSFLPVHFVGALVEGSVPANGWNLNYNVGVGNGRGAVISRDGDFGDINNSRATLVNVFVKPQFLYGAQMGGSFYHDQLSPTTAPAAEEWIESGHLVKAQGIARIHCRIRQRNPQTQQWRSDLQQPGLLCPDRLPVAEESEAVEALLPLRIPSCPPVRPHLPQHRAELLRLYRRNSLRHHLLCRV